MESYSEKQYPPQKFEEENQQNSFYMNEYNRYEQDSPSHSKSENCIGKCTRWTLYFLPFLFFLVCFVLLIVVLSMQVQSKSDEVDSAVRALVSFNENIHAAPLYEIQVIDNNASCPNGYNKKVVYTWPGVDFGCICSDGSIYTESCFARTSCPDVSSMSSINNYIWQNATLCLKTYTNPQFIVPGNSCPEGYRLAQSYLCLDSSEALSPIVKMEFLDVLNVSYVPESDESDEYIPFPEENTNSSWVKVLHIVRGTTLAPYVNIQAKISNPPCLDPEYEPTTTSGTYFPLLNVASVGCLYWGDSTSYVSVIGNETQALFNEENKLDTVFDEIYDYDNYVNSEDFYQLYGVKRISLGNTELCNSIDGNSLTEINESSQALLDNISAGAAIALALSTIGLIFALCYIFCRGCRIGQKYYCQARALPITLYVLGFIVCIILFCLAGYYYNEATNITADVTTEDYLTELINGECFNVSGHLLAAQSLETFLAESITTVGPIIVFLMAWAIVFAVVFILCWILRSCIKRLPLFI